MKIDRLGAKMKVQQLGLKAHEFFRKWAPKVNAASRKLDEMLGNPISPMKRLGLLLVLKYLYILLTVIILKDQWYVGYGSYGIAFCFWKEIIGTLAFIPVCLLYMKTNIKDRFSDRVLYFLLVIYYIPLNSAFAINDQPFLFFLSSNLYFALLIVMVGVGMKLLGKYQNAKKTGAVRTAHSVYYNDRNVIIFCVLICCLFIIYKLFYNGLSLSVSMDSNDVYGNRGKFVAYLDEISGTLLSYLFAILRNVTSFAAPFYVFISLLRRKPNQVLLGMLCILAQYSISSSKSVLLFVAVIAVLYLCHRLKLLKRFKRIFEIGMLALMMVCLLEHFLFKSDRVFTLLIRRMLYYPAWLSTMYYEYFMENGPVLWTQNVFLLQNILTPVYDTSPLTLISQVYFGGQVPSPNTGLFAEAVMHFGFAGVMIYPVILTVVLMISAVIFKQYGVCIQLFMAIKIAIQLQNVPITRTDSVLSLFLFTFALWLLPMLHLKNIRRILPEGKKNTTNEN